MIYNASRYKGNRKLLIGGLLVATLAIAAFPLGRATAGEELSMGELSLEDFLNIEVTSVSKKAQRLVEAPSAAFVLTSEDIRRSGHTSIPEMLRMVPGVQVARMGSHGWAISARGFASEFSNKLLVLIDGRSIYTPLFSGVYWDIQDMALEDIERIEVIRGPGATVWGANAVNGVINIITRHAKDSDSFVSVASGNFDKLMTSFRVNGALGDDLHYRMSGRYFNREEFEEMGTGADYGDSWRQGRTGMRFDWKPNSEDAITFSWNYYSGDARSTVRRDVVLPGTGFPNPPDPFGFLIENGATDVWGGDAVFRWRHEVSERASTELKVYYDNRKRDRIILEENRRTFDVAFQNQFGWGDEHDVIWGVGARLNDDRLGNSLNLAYTDTRGKDLSYSAFAQDEIALSETFSFTLGTKVEWSDYSGWDVQPSARFMWTPASNHQVWGSVSRAVRTRSRAERHLGSLLINVIPAGFSPTCPIGPTGCVVDLFGDERLDSEVLVAFEMGYRIQPSPTLALDFTAFYNDYESLSDFGTLSPLTPSSFVYTDRGNAHTYGLEASSQWKMNDWWKLVGTYTGLQVQTHDGSDEATAPHNQLSVRSLMDLPGNVELDAGLYYVGRTRHSAGRIDGHWRGDLRLGWTPRPGLELSLVGQNLIDDDEPEWSSPLFEQNGFALIERAFYGKVTWAF